MFRVLFISLLAAAPVMSTYLRGDDPEMSILLGGRSFASRMDFIASGARCRTADLPQFEKDAMELKLASLPTAAVEGEDGSERVQSIKVYFHIITTSSGVGAVSDAVIKKQLNVLNEDFSGSGSQFRFTLAGTDRKVHNSWATAAMGSSAEDQMKSALRKGSYGDLNIYTTVQPDQTLGWATYPGNSGNDFSYDGVIVDFRTFPGGDFFPYNGGRTATHEVGHWMGLFHTFEGGCDPNKSDGGDKISDTPAEKHPNSGCPPDSTDTCPSKGNDPIHNYMDYTDDGCMDNFTPKQVKRMRMCWAAYRRG